MQAFTFYALIEGTKLGEPHRRKVRVTIPALNSHGVMDTFDNVLRREIAEHLEFEGSVTWDWHGIEHGYGWWTLWEQLNKDVKFDFIQRHRKGMSSACNTALGILMTNSLVTKLTLTEADILRSEFKLEDKESVWRLFNNEYNVYVVDNGEGWKKSEDLNIHERIKMQGHV